LLPTTDNKLVQEMLADRNLHIALIRQHLAAAENIIKLQADKHHTGIEFDVEELVLLRL
jgi:hypothetical protein